MKRLVTITIATLILIAAGVSAQAQTASSLVVTIPFDFSTGKTSMKAGTYTVRRLSGNMLSLRNEAGKSSVLNAPLTLGARDAKAGERLVFNKYGDRYVLSQVWLTSETGRQLFTSNEEMKISREFLLSHKQAGPERVEVIARTR